VAWAGAANSPPDCELLLRNADGAQFPALLAQTISEKLRQGIARPVELGEFGLLSTVSIAARLFGPGETVEQRLRHADLALYKAKSAGRGCVCFFDPFVQVALDARGLLAGGLRQTWLGE
jgi:GGDEF domain-containing protein